MNPTIKRIWKVAALIGLGTLLPMLVCGILFCLIFGPHRITVLNSAGVPLRNVVFTISEPDGTPFIQRNATQLMPNETIVVRHWTNDSSASLRFEAEGKQFDSFGEYLDLWSGESWKFEINPGGTIKSWYD